MVTTSVRATHPSRFTVLLDVEQRLKYDVANNHSAFVRQRDREREAEQLKVRCIMQGFAPLVSGLTRCTPGHRNDQ